MSDFENPVRLYTAANSVDARALADHLANRGIEVRILGESLQGMQGGVPFGSATGVEVWTSQGCAEAAAQEIAAWESQVASRVRQTTQPPLQFRTISLLINMTVAAVCLAILQMFDGDERRALFGMFVSGMIGANLMVMAYRRKQRG